MAVIGMPHMGFVSHLGSAVRLGAVLAAQGHRVLAWGPSEFRSQIEASGAEFHAHDQFPLRPQLGTPQALAAALAEEAERCAADMIETFFRSDVDLIVHDIHVLWARIAANFLGIPRLACTALFPGSERDVGPFHPLDTRLARMPSVAQGIQRAIARVERSRAEIGSRWGVDIGNWLDALVSTSVPTANFSTEEIVGVIDNRDEIAYVGPLAGPAADRAPGRPRPFVYISLGTVYNFSPDLYRTLIDAVSGQPWDVVVTLGGGPVKEADLAPLPANVTVRSFIADPGEVLSQADAFLTHAGSSSVHEALLAGVPMVCVPQGADQFAWSARLKSHGVAEVPAQTPDGIRAATERVLKQPSFRASAERLAEHLARFDGGRRVEQLVDAAIAQRTARGATV